MLGPLARYTWNLINDGDCMRLELIEATKKKEEALRSIDKAVRAMVQKQKDLMLQQGHSCPEEVGIFKVRIQNIEIWQKGKVEKASENVENLLAKRAEKQAEIDESVADIVMKVKNTWKLNKPLDDDCDGLMAELEEVVQNGDDQKPDTQPMSLENDAQAVSLEKDGAVPEMIQAVSPKKDADVAAASLEKDAHMLEESQAVSPKKEQAVSPKKDDNVLAKQPKSPKKDDDVPAKQPASPKKDDDVPVKQPVSPKKDDDVPVKQPVSPKKDDDVPAKQPASPKKDDDVPVKQAVSPKKKDDDVVAKQPASPKKDDDVAGSAKKAAEPMKQAVPDAGKSEMNQSTRDVLHHGMMRKDTMQLQADMEEEDPTAVLQDDGTYLYQGPGGRWETGDERRTRLGHNLKMQFHRSFKSLLSATML